MKVHIIRIDGREETHTVEGDRIFDKIALLIGASMIETVNVFKNPANRPMFGFRTPVMLIDEDGYEVEVVDHGPGKGIMGGKQFDFATRIERKAVRAKKPTNTKATALYHSICVPGTTHEVVGDVAFVDDDAFE